MSTDLRAERGMARLAAEILDQGVRPMTRTAFVIPPDEQQPCRTITWDHDDELIDLLYDEIGCDTVDLIPLYIDDHEITAWVDDDGLYADPVQPNPRATRVARLAWCRRELVGVVVLTGGADDDGDTRGLPDAVLAALDTALGPVTTP